MKLISYCIAIILVSFIVGCSSPTVTRLSLEGNWIVKLDSANVGLEQEWAKKDITGDLITLPGTLDDAGIGVKNTQEPVMDNSVLWGLTRKVQYIGAAWYQKEISIPSNWKGKKITLQLERVIWESKAFVDGELIGKNESLTAPHRYDLSSSLTPGKHLITIRIDNSNLYPLINVPGKKYPDPVNQDMAHAYTNHTQIKWNGIIGDLSITATEKNKVEDLKIHTQVSQGKIKATFKYANSETDLVKYRIKANDTLIITEGEVEKGKNEITIDKPKGIKLWDEFNPNLYEFEVFTANASTSTTFGYKQIEQKNGVLTLNGNRIFLRGNLECVIFPLTGHPLMEKTEWAKLISQAKAYGLNHLRFHSWCPPKAAFEAADEAGFYYQVELPHWSLRFGEDQKTTDFLVSEADRILKEYGNHPSFILMALGNELQGDAKLLNSTVADLKAKDKRRLYMTTCYSFQKPLGLVAQPEDEYFVTQKTDKGWVRGQGIFNAKAPHFNQDYTATCQHVTVPIISHEIGQYSVYPDMTEIKKYTGVLKPLNLMAVRNELKKKGLMDLSSKFTYASGRLAAMLYKEEIERALKTPDFDGFQLLQLQDFPGQGTALVGLLNAFWESKGAISAEEFSQFNSELVPLIRFDKAIYENGEKFIASLEIANFYKKINGQDLEWSLTNKAGKKVKEGVVKGVNLKIGNNTELGKIELDVDVKNAQRLDINFSLKGTKYKNTWPVWFYPKKVKTTSNKVVITKSFADAKKALSNGKTVLYNPDYKYLKGIDGRFVPVFWSPVHFPKQPSTMGLLMDENHKAFSDFPTSGYTEWQWWDLCIKSKSLVVDDLDVTPIVRVIDNFVTNHHLANVFETKVGNGKLVFSSIDLTSKLSERPVARQLRSSLINYMESEQFNPSGTIKIKDLDFTEKTKMKEFKDSDIYNE